MLRHHGWNISGMPSSPRVSLSHSPIAVIERDFGGSHALPSAERDLKVVSDPEDNAEADEQQMISSAGCRLVQVLLAKHLDREEGRQG
jgi:hypothetical protein